MLAAAIAATGTAIAACVNAGWTFYQDPGAVTLVVAAITAVAALFGGRSYQAGKLTEGVDPTRMLDQAPDAVPITATDVSAQVTNGKAAG
jgi:hypothetical protein